MVHKFELLVLVFLAVLLAACGQDEIVEGVVVVTETAVPPTIPSPTTTYAPTPSPTQTAVPTKLPTATATTIPTRTPLPTFAPDELETAVADLLANPMNCDVPCWWGAVPGETTLDEAKHAIAPYNFDIYEYNDEEGNEYFRLGIDLEEEQSGYDVKIVYGFSDSILTDVTTYSPSISISEILAIYGQPDQVWISAENDPREQPPLIRIAIAYLQKGVGIGHYIYGNVQDDMLIGCFADEKTGHLHLTTPGRAVSYKDFSTIFNKETLYLPLSESSNLTIDDFSKLSNNPNQPQCLETPTELWE